ncbi:MAG: hypothetical protein IKM96_04320 [Clostridiales bacterium]|nr:hypothetical protein [Clostridiales bacterium]
MNNKTYLKYYLLSFAGLAIACAYPVSMGIKVILMMAVSGAVPYKEYPKYIIPYTPIAVSLIAGVLIMPLIQKLFRRIDIIAGSAAALAVFFVTETFMETKILVMAERTVVLGSWQMSLCYVPPDQFESRPWKAVDVLLGGYSPLFKVHFYLISVVIIIALLNSFYGFARMIRTGDYKKKRALAVQTVTGVMFLGMCIWACFTAFYRTGDLVVKPVSAVLMGTFFALLGVTAGIFAASLTIAKRRLLSTVIPVVTSVLVTVLMYIGEMFLLNGHLYRFGRGLLFRGIPGMVLAPADILIIAAAGVITAVICVFINKKSND